MSAETALRAALLAHGPLLAVVPAARISINAVAPDAVRPYIAFAKQQQQDERGLDGTLHASTAVIDVQCIGLSQDNAIATGALVRDALAAAGQPAEAGTAGYDEEHDLPVEVVTVNWLTVY